MSERIGTHWIGDSCPGGHLPAPAEAAAEEKCVDGPSARWCADCGDCSCGPAHDSCEGGSECMCHPACPLHGESSTHATVPYVDPRDQRISDLEAALQQSEARHDEIRALCEKAGVHHPAVILSKLEQAQQALQRAEKDRDWYKSLLESVRGKQP